MFNLKKKAMSDVIASVLLIVLAVALAGILSSFIVPLVKQNTNFSPAVSCIELTGNPLVTIENVCFNNITKDIELTVLRDTKDFDLFSLSFSVKDKDRLSSFSCDRKCKNCQLVERGAEKKYFFSFPEFSGSAELSYSINGCVIKSVEVSRIC